jgi:hypothetical protein
MNEKPMESRPVKRMKTADEAPKLLLMTQAGPNKRGLGKMAERQGALCDSNPTHKHFNVMHGAAVLFMFVRPLLCFEVYKEGCEL